MMSANDFDVFDGTTTTSTTTNGGSKPPEVDGEEAILFDSVEGATDRGPTMEIFGGAAGDGYTHSNAHPNPDMDVFETGNNNSSATASGGGSRGSGAVGGDDFGVFEECKLNDAPTSNVSSAPLADDDDDAGDDLLDMEGWKNRRNRSIENQQDGEDYGVDNSDIPEHATDQNTPSMSANTKADRNNSRRGLFGGWGGNRKGQQGDENDLLSGDTASPSWSNASNASSSSARGSGFFGRRGNNNNNSSGNLDSTHSQDSNSPNKLPRDSNEASTLSYGEGGITGDFDQTEEEIIQAEIEDEEAIMDNKLRVGDHIFIWQTYGVNPRAYQRHGVVFSVTKRGDVDPLTQRAPQGPSQGSYEEDHLSFDMDTLYTDEEDDVEVTVVSFYHFQRHHRAHGAAQAHQAAGSGKGRRFGSRREHLYDFIGPDGITRKKPVHKVRYGRKVKKGLLSQKAGVGTALKKDQVGLILARVQYVLDHPDHLPAHNFLSANGECASLWCVTGRWCTLQGASILAITSVGQAGGALLAGGILSNLTVLVPMPGVWGMAGWWWYVPATVAYPFLVPMLVAMGMASLVPLEILRRNRKKWRAITDGLNHEFWSGTSEEIKEEYFGVMATAEKEAEMRSFFGVRENEVNAAEDSKYMPLGGAPGGIGGDSDDDNIGSEDDDEADEAAAMQRMEASCKNMAADMNVDLSGKPPEKEGSQNKGAWGSFVGSFRRNGSGRDEREELAETERFRTTY